MSKISQENRKSCLYLFGHWVWCGYVLLLQVPSINGAYGNVVSLPGECRDVNGKKVEQDAHYVPPGSDTCRLCLCDNGHPKACKAVLCSPPHDCKSFQIGSSCCEFICLDDTIGNTADKNYDVGIRLRHRKSRAQEGREVIDDPNQRNLVNNVGYMGGSIGYLGGGTMNMDYSYVDHAVAPHYQLWKPPGAYYTRGEAPPPYEEAIAIAHAESLSSCTVSVATSTGRNYPLGVVQDSDAAPNITANTTNLISININGTGHGGNVTEIGGVDSNMGARSVATITNEDSPFVTSSNNRVSGVNGRSTLLNGGDRHSSETNEDTSMTIYNHHPSNLLHQNDVIDVNDGLCENVNLSSNHHCTGSNTISFSSVGSDLCMNSSCELNINAHQCNFTHHQVTVAAVNVSSGEFGETGVHRVGIKEDHCSSMFQNPNRLSDGADKFIDASHHRHCQQTVTGNCGDESSQLPASSQSPISQSLMQSVPVPAMFNDDMISDSKFSNYSDKSTDVIKNRITGKKYHRTIPRHFSVVDPIINPIKTNFLAAGTAATATTPTDSSASFTLVQQDRVSGDVRDKQTLQRTPTKGAADVTTSPNMILASANGNTTVANRKVCQCPIQHKALTGYQSTTAGRSSAISSIHGDDSYRSLRPTSKDILQNRGDSCNKQTSSHGDHAMVASKRSNGLGTMRENYGTERTPLKRASEPVGLMNQRFHEKEHRKTASSFSDATIGTGGNRVKAKLQPNYQHRTHSDHSSHIAASERKVTTQLPLDELMSTRLTTRPGIESEDRPHSVLKKSSLNTNMNNEANSGLHNPILPPKAKKQQHQQSRQNQAYNKNIAPGSHQLHDGSLVHQKILSLPEKPNDGNNGGGNKLRELRKSPMHITHDTGGVLKVCNNNVMSSGFSNSLPRHSFAAIRNYERKQRNDNLFFNNFGKGTKQHRPDGVDSELLQEKVLYDSNTMPKNIPNHNGRKTSLVTEAVNHIPPIINIPVTSHSAMSFGRNANSNNQSTNNVNCSNTANTTAAENSNHSSVVHGSAQIALQAATLPNSTNGGSRNNDDGGTNSNSIKQPILLPLPVLMTTITNCANPREHMLPNDNSLDEDYLSECENCKSSANNMRYYLDLEDGSKTCAPIQETMTLQRKIPDAAEEVEQNYYRVSSTLPTNTSKRNVPLVNKDRVAWFSTIPASSSSDDEEVCE
uniref:VWFC domain-containing protein n=1 Tax=Anopheles funestus TaxID=62324 RepID=A0A4Y0BJS4_ANOFN